MSTYNKKESNRIWQGDVAPTVSNLILIAIIQAGTNGITGKELERRSGISRMTIWKQRVRLYDEGFIYYQTKGKRTTYYPTKQATSNLYFRSWIRYKQLFGLLESRRIPISSPFYKVNFPNYFDSKLEMSLLEFTLRIGILITSILVQHLSPNKVKKSKRRQNRNVTKIANKLVEESVRNIISPVKMLIILRQILKGLGYRFSISTAKKSNGYSFYEMEFKSFEEIVTALKSVFPEACEELQAIDFDDAKHWVTKRIEYIKKRKEQLNCKHEYQIETTDKKEIYHCVNCKLTSIIDRDTIIGNKEVLQKLNSIRPPSDTCRNHRWKVCLEKMPSVSFECSLCHKIASILIESEDNLDVIKAEIETDDRLDLKDSIGICEDIELFFHRHSNRGLTVNHYIKYYEQHHMKKIVDLWTFRTEVEIIYEILAKSGYIEGFTGKRDDKLIGYLRRENIEIRSVTGKRLLTLVSL